MHSDREQGGNNPRKSRDAGLGKSCRKKQTGHNRDGIATPSVGQYVFQWEEIAGNPSQRKSEAEA